MHHVLRSLLFGTLLLCALALVNGSSSQTFAASSQVQTNSSYSPHHYPGYEGGRDDYSYNYSRGYQDGFSDCQRHIPPADSFYQGEGYRQGYNDGYQFCQRQRARGYIQGNEDGYQDGYRTCQQEHSRSFHQVELSPHDQGYSEGYKQAFRQGYDDCEAQYSHTPLYSSGH